MPTNRTVKESLSISEENNVGVNIEQTIKVYYLNLQNTNNGNSSNNGCVDKYAELTSCLTLSLSLT
jgi:hypothetical protein